MVASTFGFAAVAAAAFCTVEGEVGALLAYFTDDAVYHNIPFRPAVGKEAIETTLKGIMEMTSRGWEVKHQVAQGDVVLNERVDRFERDGKPMEIPVCGDGTDGRTNRRKQGELRCQTLTRS